MNRLSFLPLVLIALLAACEDINPPPQTSNSGVRQTSVRVQTQADGRTVEQQNIAERYTRDNVPGSIKHLYVISTYSGQVLIYSTVRGKVTSSGKRLTPTEVAASDEQYEGGIPVDIAGRVRYTPEVIQDDGTYGTSIPYLFWFDTKGVFHQHYPEGGQIIHISDQPMRVPRIILNMETNTVNAPESPPNP